MKIELTDEEVCAIEGAKRVIRQSYSDHAEQICFYLERLTKKIEAAKLAEKGAEND